MYFPRWWGWRPAAIRSLKFELAHNKVMLTTPDYAETVLDSEGNNQPWNAETEAKIQEEISAIEAELVKLGVISKEESDMDGFILNKTAPLTDIDELAKAMSPEKPESPKWSLMRDYSIPGYRIRHENVRGIYDVAGVFESGYMSNTEAEILARKFMAAPELLEAAKSISKSYHDSAGGSLGYCDIERLDKAIAKAEGNTKGESD